MITATQAASAIVERSEVVEQLRRELEASPNAASDLLSELASNPNPIVRHWVVLTAPSVIGSAAESLLERLLRDADLDVRTDAMRELVGLDHVWITRLVSQYLVAIESRDFLEAGEAIWRLVQFRATSALPRLQQLAERSPHPAVRNQARVASLVLEGNEDELLKAIVRHDHDLMSIWVKGLVYLGTQRALDALADYSTNAPDEPCRRRARGALKVADRVRPAGLN